MELLLTNDDGIEAPGLAALAEALSSVASVTVVAPLSQRSGAASSITAHEVIAVHEYAPQKGIKRYAVDGTPVDCVRIALFDIVKPDYMFAGINPGANLSPHVYHSGTVSAANEAVMLGITSTAVSVEMRGRSEIDFSPAADAALKWFKVLLENDLPNPVLYNINIPCKDGCESERFMPATLSPTPLTLRYSKERGINGKSLYTMVDTVEQDPPAGSDLYWLKKGYTTVSPMLSNRAYIEVLKQLENIIVNDK